MSSLEDIFQTNKVGREYVQLVQYVQTKTPRCEKASNSQGNIGV